MLVRGDDPPEPPILGGPIPPDPPWEERRAALVRGSRRPHRIDAGTRDEFHLDLGAEAFHAALRDVGVADDLVHFELFEAGHMGIDYRYPLSLAWLCGRMNP